MGYAGCGREGGGEGEDLSSTAEEGEGEFGEAELKLGVSPSIIVVSTRKGCG